MKPNEEAFVREYGKLNPAQREAVDTIEGPVMVIAGPGTGKTQILTLRIANIMRQTDVPRDAILALTFTNAAAANMRKRLVRVVGSDAYRVSIFTFHSFANHIIESYPERFGAIAGFTNVSDVEQVDIIRSLLDSGSYELVKPLGDPYKSVQDILHAIKHLKKEGFGPDAFTAWVEQAQAAFSARDDLVHVKGAHKGKMKVEHQKTERALAKNAELAELYRRYQKELSARKHYDFDDALLSLGAALEQYEDFLRELQEEYQYFLVDEHQDTNGAQNKILEMLTTYFDAPNLFVVGDEKQAIFRFQGASLQNFLYFEKKFKNVRRITLRDNYRSHQGVLDAAHSLITHAREGVPAPLAAHRGAREKIDVYTLGADDEELLFLVESIQERLHEGVPAHEICVLYRNNRDVEPIRDYFERLGIPFVVESGHGVLDDPDIRKLNLILTALCDLTNDDTLARVLFIGFLEVPIQDVYTLIHTARVEEMSLYTALRATDPSLLAQPESIRALATMLDSWKSAAENEPFLHFFEQVVRESGLLAHIQTSTFHVEKFDKLVRLFDEIKAHVARSAFFSLEDYTTFLTILTEHNMTLEAKARHIPNAVHLMTAHKAKGLEFDEVYLVNAYDGHWGGKRSRSAFRLPSVGGEVLPSTEDTEDERRLFFVGITRARARVSISYSALSPDGKERVPTQFLAEIDDSLKREHTAADVGVGGKRPPLFVPRTTIEASSKYREFVRAHFAERGLSATALNAYLSCPWAWFYGHFFHSQFVKSVHQKRGTAVHHALQLFFNKRNTQPNVPVDFLLTEFREALDREDLEPSAFERIERDTSKALLGWHTEYAASWPEKTINELRIQGVVVGDDILLNGSLDKLECLGDSCREVDVIDYKTGKPKSKNHIEGGTSAKGSGDYKRQLVFYKLLLEHYDDGHYRMRQGILDFVEPNERGIYKKETCTIDKSAVVELTDTIQRVADEIRSLAFWNTRCDEPKCEFCALRDVMDTDAQ